MLLLNSIASAPKVFRNQSLHESAKWPSKSTTNPDGRGKRRIEAELHTECEGRAPSYHDPCGPPSFDFENNNPTTNDNLTREASMDLLRY